MRAHHRAVPELKLNHSIPKDAYVLLIGAMKCGTTSLFHYLALHPEICPSVIKEPEFFSRGPGGKNPNAPQVAVQHYEDLWAFDPLRHRYALEASTGYTKFPLITNVPEKIYDAGICPRFIYVVRNPFDRIESQLNHNIQKGRTDASLCDEKYVAFSNYYCQLQRYTRLFPRENILILDYDQLNKNPTEIMHKIYEFLGLKAHPLPKALIRENVMNNGSVSSYIFKNRVLEKLFRKHRYWLVPFLDGLFPPPGRPKLSPGERKIISAALYDDMQKLQSEFGVDVKKWGF